ncbi:polyprenyl synthetase family protein [Xanthobacter dioxanivorans]|nr:polyprenyl synthetase family protein [Xanthobacter dioxanivorans]
MKRGRAFMAQKGGRNTRTETPASHDVARSNGAQGALQGALAVQMAEAPAGALHAEEAASAHSFPPRSRDLSYLRAVIDRRLGLLVPPPASHPAVLHAAMRHILLAPGKRLRPLLAMAAAIQLDASEHAALDFGCALEMIHASSLIVDDLPSMDDAAMRRSQPTTHVQYGEDVAVLAAIALLSRAFGVAAAAPAVPEPVRLDAVSILSLAVGSLGLCGGQYDDLRPSTGRSLAATEDVNRRKTGVLFSAAVEIAGRVAGADEAQFAHLRAVAGHVGRAYQILDDILDASSSAAALGKDVGKDAHKVTVIASLGAPRARKLLAEHLAGALSASKELGPNKDGQEPLRDFMDAAFGELMGPLAL